MLANYANVKRGPAQIGQREAVQKNTGQPVIALETSRFTHCILKPILKAGVRSEEPI